MDNTSHLTSPVLSRFLSTTRGVAHLRSRSLWIDRAVLVVAGVGLMSAMAQISLPLPGSPVPITGQTLGALLIGGTLGYQVGVTSYLAYLALGILGAPVFAGATFGWAKIAGATGGYLVGMLIATAILGFGVKRGWDKKLTTWLPTIALGEVAIFSLGVTWLHYSTSQSFAWSISKGFTPFILGEVIKIGIATTSMPYLWKLVNKNAH